jgi:sulfotransferase
MLSGSVVVFDTRTAGVVLFDCSEIVRLHLQREKLREFKRIQERAFLLKSRQTTQMLKHSTHQNYHFVFGLPFAGTSQLTSLLQQNPHFRVARRTLLATLFKSANGQISSASRNSAALTENQRTHVLRGLFSNFYADMPASRVVFESNRDWAGLVPDVLDVFLGAKFIACVRDVAWVLDSMERMHRTNPEACVSLFKNLGESISRSSRAAALCNDDGYIGLAWAAIRAVFAGNHSSSLLVIDYELLQSKPDDVLSLIYNFLDIPWFCGHDLSAMNQWDDFDDASDGKPLASKTILNQEVFDMYSNRSFWLDDSRTSASIISVKANESTQLIRLQA